MPVRYNSGLMEIHYSRNVRWLLAAVAILPAIGGLLMVRQFGVNVHYFDEWAPGLAGLFVKAHQHQVTFADLFAQHNEHRILVPRLFFLLVNPFTHWNAIAGLVMEWGIIAVTSLIVLDLIRRTDEPSDQGKHQVSGQVLILWFLCNLLIFSPVQYENLLWGMGLVNVMPTLFIFMGLWVAGGGLNHWMKFLLCFILATAATYSSGNGVLAWGLVGVVLIVSVWPAGRRMGMLLAILWIVGCVLNVAVYFHGYVQPPDGGVRSVSSDPVAIVIYVVTFLGGPFAHTSKFSALGMGQIFGLAMLGMYLGAGGYFVYFRDRRELRDRMLVWFMVGGYAIFSACIAGRFRAGSGSAGALVSRYSSYAIYLPVSLVILVWLILEDLHLRHPKWDEFWSALPKGLVGALVLVHYLSLSSALVDAATIGRVSRQAKGAFLYAGIFPDSPGFVRPISGDIARTRQEAIDLGGFGYLQPPLLGSRDAERIRATDADEISSVEGRVDVFTYDESHRPIAGGWAIKRKTLEAVDSVFLTYDTAFGESRIFAVARLGANRGDVARQMRDPAYEWSGWVATLSFDDLPKDRSTFQITAWVLDADTGRAVPLDGQIQLKR